MSGAVACRPKRLRFGFSEHERFPEADAGCRRSGIPPSGWREKLLISGRSSLYAEAGTILTQGEAILFRVQILSGPSSSRSPTGEMYVQRAYRLVGTP